MEENTKLRAATNNAYCLLRSRPRSEAELRGRLKLKRYDEATIDSVVESLKKIGEIDDRKFAGFWVESRMHANPLGKSAIKRELKFKGVAEPLIQEALDKVSESYDEYEVALNMARRRFNSLAKLDRKKASKRLHDYLLRREFDYDIVKRVIGTLIDENG